jgi:hypothetical protein
MKSESLVSVVSVMTLLQVGERAVEKRLGQFVELQPEHELGNGSSRVRAASSASSAWTASDLVRPIAGGAEACGTPGRLGRKPHRNA